MHRIDTSTATPDHKFTEGDPTIPVAATTVSAEWLNAVQEELVAVITGAGLELKKSDNGQLWKAISQLITNAKPGLATKAKPGLVQVGGGLNITPEGLLSVLAASVTQAGIVQLASGLSDSTTTAPTCKAVKDAIESKLAAVNVPVGGILPFSGTFGGEGNRFPIPLGEDAPDMHWCLCDGTTTNGLPVPDLRGRMIRGASDSVPAGSTGSGNPYDVRKGVIRRQAVGLSGRAVQCVRMGLRATGILRRWIVACAVSHVEISPGPPSSCGGDT